jgi:hypothetical protein
MKGDSHAPRPIELAPNQVSPVVLLSAIVGCNGWAAVKDCIHIEDAKDVPDFVRLITPSKKAIEIAVRTKAEKRGRPRRHKIRISARSKPRAIRADIIVDKKEIRKLEMRKLLKLVPFVPIYPPSTGSYGYDDDFYICDDCGHPIVFRGFPPTPIHV